MLIKRNITIASWMEEEINRLILDFPKADLTFSKVIRHCIESSIAECAVKYEEMHDIMEKRYEHS